VDQQEARSVLEGQLLPYRSLGYERLLRLLKEQDVFEVVGTSGTVYQLEIQAVWDGRKGGDLRVMGSIDDNRSGGSYGYRMSKAALNIAGKLYS